MKLTNNDFIRLKTFMYNNYGINLENKKTLIETRLAIVVKRLGFNDFKSYIDNLMRDKTGEQTPNSCEVYDNIGRCAYDTLVAEMLDNICKLYGYLIIESREKTIAERDSLKAMLNSHGVFDEVESLRIDLAQAKNICRENE